MIQKIVDRYRYPMLLLNRLVRTDFKLRYEGSTLGYVWSLLKPLALFGILYVVFSIFLRVGEGIDNFPIYLLLGIVVWNYFAEVTMNSVQAVVSKGDLIRKINFPKYIIVLSGSFSALINLVLNMIVVFVFMLVLGLIPSFLDLAIFLLLVVELFVFSLAISFLLSALYVKFRDVNYIWEVFLQGAFYATPILYPIALAPEVAQKILVVNPIAQIIQDMREVLITTKTDTIAEVFGNADARYIPVVATVILTLVTARYFRNKSNYFAEKV